MITLVSALRFYLSAICWLVAIVGLGSYPTIASQSSLRFDTPAEWLSTETTSQMRLSQFILPKVDGDTEDAELVVFYFGGEGGIVETNIKRWTEQMLQPDGLPSTDVSTTTNFLIGDLQVTVLDVPGTFSAAVRPGSKMLYYKTGFRLKAAVVETPLGPYFFKLVGPDRTVVRWETSFAMMLESIRLE